MRLHRVLTYDKDQTRMVYAGSEAEARKRRRELMLSTGLKLSDLTIEVVEIPTTKAALIAWLNELGRPQRTVGT